MTATSAQPIGFCQCGCGQLTSIVKVTNTKQGRRRGEPSRYALGHTPRTLPRPNVSTTSSIPLGLCQCGCGRATEVAKLTSAKHGRVKGQPTRFFAGHTSRIGRCAPQCYPSFVKNGKLVPKHIEVAEKALGHALPNGAEVHHVDEDRRNFANHNLVICQDHAYHLHLHVRTRVVKAGGDPNRQRICTYCHKPTFFSDLVRRSNPNGTGGRVCKPCQKAKSSLNRQKAKAEAA